MDTRTSLPLTEPAIVRGPTGLRGAPGLSAYGVWLDQGHSGTANDFLNWLRHSPPIWLYQHTGGQRLLSGQNTALQRTSAGNTLLTLDLPGLYMAGYYMDIRCGDGVFALYCGNTELPASRYGSTRPLYGMAVFEITQQQTPAQLQLRHIGAGICELGGSQPDAVDAYLLLQRLEP